MIRENLPYDNTSADSILSYAKKLENSTLRLSCDKTQFEKKSNKGSFGVLLEELYFFYKRNSLPEPDFPEADLELKTGGLKKLKIGNRNLVNKEGKLNLSMVNYETISEESFEESQFLHKNKSLLLVFHLYDEKKNPLDKEIKIVGHWSIPKDDMLIIKSDWKMIKRKIENGIDLHQCDGEYMDCMSKQGSHCFGLKGNYLKHIIYQLSSHKEIRYGEKLIKQQPKEFISLEDHVMKIFKPHFGKDIVELSSEFDIPLGSGKSKYSNFIKDFSKDLLNVNSLESIDEFVKSGMKIKVCRVDSNNLPAEDVSFPAFHFADLVNEDWEDSSFNQNFQNKFLFIFIKIDGKKKSFDSAKFWKMSKSDLNEIRVLWQHTKNIIESGKIVKQIKNERRETYFQNKLGTEVAHVRTHATLTTETYPLPVKELLTGANEYTRHSIYMNKEYVKNNIY